LDDDMRMYPAVNDGMPALLHSNGRRLGKVWGFLVIVGFSGNRKIGWKCARML
jgi:hypothetical protein